MDKLSAIKDIGVRKASIVVISFYGLMEGYISERTYLYIVLAFMVTNFAEKIIPVLITGKRGTKNEEVEG